MLTEGSGSLFQMGFKAAGVDHFVLLVHHPHGLHVLQALHQGCPSFLSFVFPGEFRLSFVDFRRHLQASRHHCLSSACRLFGSRRFPSVPFKSFQARSTHVRLPWGDNRPCVYLRKREGSSILSRSLASFYQISESCGLQVRRFRNVLIGRHRNRMKPYEKQEQMFHHYSHSIILLCHDLQICLDFAI